MAWAGTEPVRRQILIVAWQESSADLSPTPEKPPHNGQHSVIVPNGWIRSRCWQPQRCESARSRWALLTLIAPTWGAGRWSTCGRLRPMTRHSARSVFRQFALPRGNRPMPLGSPESPLAVNRHFARPVFSVPHRARCPLPMNNWNHAIVARHGGTWIPRTRAIFSDHGSWCTRPASAGREPRMLFGGPRAATLHPWARQHPTNRPLVMDPATDRGRALFWRALSLRSACFHVDM